MAKSVLVLIAVALVVQSLWCATVAEAGRGPVYVGGGVRPVIARPGREALRHHIIHTSWQKTDDRSKSDSIFISPR
uniref:Uncharacterized protein n=1 Tax=Anopheles farauti TaxID=69004 RepID=A0A182Q178_9DIPT